MSTAPFKIDVVSYSVPSDRRVDPTTITHLFDDKHVFHVSIGGENFAACMAQVLAIALLSAKSIQEENNTSSSDPAVDFARQVFPDNPDLWPAAITAFDLGRRHPHSEADGQVSITKVDIGFSSLIFSLTPNFKLEPVRKLFTNLLSGAIDFMILSEDPEYLWPELRRVH